MHDLPQELHHLAVAVTDLAAVNKLQLEWFKSHSNCITKHDLDPILKEIKTMAAAIQDFAKKQNAFNDKIDAAVAGITTDIQALADLIATLQGSAGTITPEDQVTLDALEARTELVSEKLDALDALNPPTPPTA